MTIQQDDVAGISRACLTHDIVAPRLPWFSRIYQCPAV
jgi:hypothetical protein